MNYFVLNPMASHRVKRTKIVLPSRYLWTSLLSLHHRSKSISEQDTLYYNHLFKKENLPPLQPGVQPAFPELSGLFVKHIGTICTSFKPHIYLEMVQRQDMKCRKLNYYCSYPHFEFCSYLHFTVPNFWKMGF